MKNTKTLEASVGILLLLGFLAFMFMALKVSGLTIAANPFVHSTYQVNGNFSDIGGLKVRAPVRIAGVQIGVVSGISLDPSTYEAHVVMTINNNVPIPKDSSASITATGILGDNYVSVAPGYAADNMHNNAQFVTTYAATSWASLISTFMGNSSNSKSTTNSGAKK